MQKKLIGLVGAAAVVCSATAFADFDPTRVPLANALTKIEENGAKNPQSRGLPNAKVRIEKNIARQQAKRDAHPPGQTKVHVNRAGTDRVQVADRVDRAERPERPDRPDRPDRPERPNRPDRPERPHK